MNMWMTWMTNTRLMTWATLSVREMWHCADKREETGQCALTLRHCGSQWTWSCRHWCTHRAVLPRNHVQFWISHFWSQLSNNQLVVRLYNLIVTFSCSHFLHTFAPRKHVIWGFMLTPPRRLQWTAVSCKRSICNKVIEFKKVCPEELFQILYNRSPRSVSTWFHLHGDLHRNKESTKNLANSTMKKSFVSIADFCQNSWTFVRLLLLFVSIAARVTMPFWSQICALFAQYWNLACSNEATSYSCRESILGYDLHPPEHPIFGKVRLDYVQSFDDGILDLVRIDHGFLGNTFSCTSSSIGYIMVFLVSQLFTISMFVRSSFLDDVLRNWKKVHRIIDELLIRSPFFMQEVPARAIKYTTVPVW